MQCLAAVVYCLDLVLEELLCVGVCPLLLLPVALRLVDPRVHVVGLHKPLHIASRIPAHPCRHFHKIPSRREIEESNAWIH